MQEKLIDVLKKLDGYHIEGNYLKRPNGTIAAELKDKRWETYPLQNEMIYYMSHCGRAYPSLLVDKDLTNPGSK